MSHVKSHKFLSAFLALSLLVMPAAAGAQSASTDALPGENLLFFQLDVRQEKTLQKFLVPKIAEEMSVEIGEDGGMTEPSIELQNLLEEIIQNSGINVAIEKKELEKIKEEGMEKTAIYISLEITEDQWTKLFKIAGENLVEETYKDQKIHHRDGSEKTFFTKIKNTVLIAEKKENLQRGIDQIVAGNTLSKNTKYQNVAGSFLTQGILNIFVDAGGLADMIETTLKEEGTENGEAMGIEETFKKSLQEVIKIIRTSTGMGVSIGKTATTFDVKTVDLYDEAKRDALGVSRKDMSYVPSIYKKIPGENLITYIELFNAKKTWEIQKEKNLGLIQDDMLLEEFGEITKEIQEETGIDLEKDVIGIFDQQIGFSLNQQGSSVAPGLTLLADVSNNAEIAKGTIEKLKKFIEKTIEKHASEVRIAYAIQEKAIKGGMGYLMTFQEPERKGRISPEEKKQLDMIFPMELSLGVTSDNTFYISSQRNFEQAYGTGVQAKEISDVLPKQYTGRFYLDIQGLTSYIKAIMAIPYETVPTEDRNYFEAEEMLKKFDTIMAPWKNIHAYGVTTPGKDEGIFIIHADTNAINEDYFNKIEEWSRVESENSNRYRNYQAPGLKDVEKGEWYYDDVRESRIYGSVNGYEDQTFKPENRITRAEFIAMVMRTAYKSKGQSYYELPPSVKDVEDGSWYQMTLAEALEKGVIQTGPDGNVRPNDEISRAEAAKIIANILDQKLESKTNSEETETRKFSDVEEKAWYAEAVERNSSVGIIRGREDGTFAPNDHLKRAEAAALMNRLRKVLN
ncbi:MAG: S-layer homology domain-containing protein [Patescibacteria group bacterium]